MRGRDLSTCPTHKGSTSNASPETLATTYFQFSLCFLFYSFIMALRIVLRLTFSMPYSDKIMNFIWPHLLFLFFVFGRHKFFSICYLRTDIVLTNHNTTHSWTLTLKATQRDKLPLRVPASSIRGRTLIPSSCFWPSCQCTWEATDCLRTWVSATLMETWMELLASAWPNSGYWRHLRGVNQWMKTSVSQIITETSHGLRDAPQYMSS